jgi:hypothetical protein
MWKLKCYRYVYKNHFQVSQNQQENKRQNYLRDEMQAEKRVPPENSPRNRNLETKWFISSIERFSYPVHYGRQCLSHWKGSSTENVSQCSFHIPVP